MSGFFDRMLGRTPKGSSATAKDRLQFVLVHDRINLPPERLREMKEEILAVISKYVSVDRDRVDIALEQRDRNSSRIVAEIPFSKEARTRQESDEYDNLGETVRSPKTIIEEAPKAPEMAKTEPSFIETMEKETEKTDTLAETTPKDDDDKP